MATTMPTQRAAQPYLIGREEELKERLQEGTVSIDVGIGWILGAVGWHRRAC